MIIDSSIIVAIAGDEPATPWIERVLRRRDLRRMPWINIAEAEIRLQSMNRLAAAPMEDLLDRLRGEPLLTLDADFLKTDLARVLHPDAG